MVIYYIGHVYLMPYVYSFSQIFHALRLLAALRLFQTLEYAALPNEIRSNWNPQTYKQQQGCAYL